jgi:hypothetical protein
MGFFVSFNSVVEKLTCEADYSPPSKAEMKNERILTYKHTNTPSKRDVYSQIKGKIVRVLN